MSLMRVSLLLVLCILFSSCYELEDGSRAEVLRSIQETNDGGEKELVWSGRICSGLYQKEFEAARSGELCSFSGGGCMTPNEKELKDTLLFREVWCGDDVIMASNVMGIEEEEPRPDAIWRDCSALDKGRTGELCEGNFRCFREGANSCLERVACVDDDIYGWEPKKRLFRCLLCDDISPRGANKDAAIYTSCEDAINARPLDRCEGLFLCARSPFPAPPTGSLVVSDPDATIETVSACEGQDGYCQAKSSGGIIVWCSDQTIHLLYSEEGLYEEFYKEVFANVI